MPGLLVALILIVAFAAGYIAGRRTERNRSRSPYSIARVPRMRVAGRR